MNTIIISKEAGISSYEVLHRMELYKYSYDDLVEYTRDVIATQLVKKKRPRYKEQTLF